MLPTQNKISQNSVLVIGAQPAIRGFLQTGLGDRFDCLWADTPRAAQQMLLTHRPGLLVWDITGRRPAPAGLNRAARDIPVLVLRDDAPDAPEAPPPGAAYYELVSPFGMDALLRAVQALYPSQVPPALSGMQAGDWRIDFIARTAARGETTLHLTPAEGAALLCMARQMGRPVAEAQLIAHIWGRDGKHDAASLRGFMAHLRRKLDDEDKPHRIIIAHPAQGYALSGTVFNKNDMSE
ncbi:MAG: winged helix-turn-helix domain-containing protein [Eubacteriales bacterium]|nr:winged helix-turn-helix domain-containing protein [Eubacteriales bacterium]